MTLNMNLPLAWRATAPLCWTAYATEDPRVRLKIGDRIYLATATRVDQPGDVQALLDSARKKYPQLPDSGDSESAERLEGIWLFRIDTRA